MISLRNYAWACSGGPERPPDSALLINFGVLQKAVGLDPGDFGDQHAATLQRGIGTSTSAADATPVRRGLIRLDAWTEDAGGLVEGALLFRTADDEANGTFTATVCL